MQRTSGENFLFLLDIVLGEQGKAHTERQEAKQGEESKVHRGFPNGSWRAN
jgi:hypothetical protein